MTNYISEFFAEYGTLLWNATLATLQMVVWSTLLAYLLGIPLGVLVVITKPHSILPRRTLNNVLGWIVNMGRSIPFIILTVALIPVSRIIMGTPLGVRGAIVPLVIAATPFVARLIENSLSDVDHGVVEVAQSSGATVFQIITKVMLPESLPSIVMGLSITLITLFGYSAMMGTVGSGGLGDVAIRYGYNRYQTDVMLATLVIMIILVQLIQMLCSAIAKKLDKRIRKA